LIELHGGSIAAASEGAGQGCTFTVMLPLVRKGATATSAVTDLPIGTEINDSLPGVRLLLVEDDVKTREALTVLLRRAGAIVQAVDHVDRAFAAIAQERPEIIVSDIGLPDRDGHSFVRQFRTETSPGAARVPALALSAFDRPQDRMNALESGFDQYLAKPVQPQLLISTLRRLLELK
jgi:CheY-like chemotaxis protein